MSPKKTTLALALAGALAMAAAGQATAGVYAGSRVEIQNLTVVIGNVTSGGPTSYSFNLSNAASLNGVADATPGITSACNSLGVPQTCNALPSAALTAKAANAPGGAPLRVDGAANNFDFFGPGASQTYANSDSQIFQSELTGAPSSKATGISEAEIAGSGQGDASTTVQSSTQLAFTFNIGAGGGSLTLAFEADPDLFVAVNTANLIGAIAQANSGATFTLTGSGGAAGVSIQWNPDGLPGNFTACAGAGVACAENNDQESLNNTVGLPPNTNPGSAGISDARGGGTDPGWSLFGITLTGLPSGNYSLTLNTTTSVNVVQRVPEPGMLALLGLGLAGMGAVARRSRKRA